MNILFVSSSYYPHINGVYYFVCRVGPMLQQRGHKIAVIAPSESMNFSSMYVFHDSQSQTNVAWQLGQFNLIVNLILVITVSLSFIDCSLLGHLSKSVIYVT